MRYHIVTLFPEWFDSPLAAGLMGKAVQNNVVDFCFHNPREHGLGLHRSVDDSPYGGGPGMVLALPPLVQTLRPLADKGVRLLALSPEGRPLDQALARELATEPEIALVCGRYEGFDARLFELLPLDCVCVGEAVLNGGECAAMALIEATARLLPGFMGKESSGDEESFSRGLLEYPHYTRPENFEGLEVPPVLLSGDHGKVALWRREAALQTTLKKRPDLLAEAPLSHKDREFLRHQPRLRPGRNLHLALLHHPVLLKDKKVGTTSLTNLDVHDIARVSRTYGIGSVQVVTPLEDQLRLLSTLLEFWTAGQGATSNPDRAEALQLVRPSASLDLALAELTRHYGEPPLLVGSSARPVLDRKGREKNLATSFGQVAKALHKRPVVLILGTGHGLAPEVLTKCDLILRPLRWMDEYNHLPVRAAAALMLDRLLGDLG